jgi:uncharacterized glyoxalase superfamily protein PhnB
MQKITPFLWYDNNAEEAVNLYISIFKNSKITDITRYGDAGPGPKGSVMTIAFQLGGQDFIALNGGPMFKFTEAISLSVDCKTQTIRRRPAGAVRLAQGQVRLVVANRSVCLGPDAARQRCRKIEPSHASHDANA